MTRLRSTPTTPTAATTVDDAPLSGFHKRLIVYSSGGPFLDGYVLSIIGVALIQATPQLQLDALWQGAVGAAALLGIFIGGFLGGWLADKYGRQVLYTIDLLAIAVFSILQFWTIDPVMLFTLRLLIGVAVGADYPIATSLVAEFTPRKYRGPALSGLIVMWFVGAAVAYVVGEIMLSTLGPDAWRWMLASAALPAIVFVLLRHGTPESPRWLASKGRMTEAMEVVHKVYGPDAKLSDVPEEQKESPIGLRKLFSAGYGRRLVFVAVFWACSTVPLFGVYAFAPAILDALGVEGEYGSALITFAFLLGAVIATLLVNRMGRRGLLIHSFLWSGIALLALGIFPQAPVVVIMACFLGYAIFIGGTQVLQWVYPNELFPTEIRGSAVGLASSLSRVGAAIGTYLVPLSLVTLGIGPTMIIGAAITILGFVVSLIMAPETTGKSLDETASL